MKIRHPGLIKAFAIAAAWLVRLWMGTLRYRYYSVGSPTLPHYLPPGERYLYAFWHEHILLPAYQCGSPQVYVLVSRHADGELIAQVCRRLGFRLIRGSTTRGSIEAVRQLLRAGQKAHLAITPDGPRGPRRRVQAGVIYLAAKTGMPIIASGIAYSNPWRLRSWDHFALPRPRQRAIIVTSAPIRVPPDLDPNLLEHYRRLVEETMHDLTARAEHWIETGCPCPEWTAVPPLRLLPLCQRSSHQSR
jgi:lysophospholipid acyltransferase (LPLAT)-like uncharacterized protein